MMCHSGIEMSTHKRHLDLAVHFDLSFDASQLASTNLGFSSIEKEGGEA